MEDNTFLLSLLLSLIFTLGALGGYAVYASHKENVLMIERGYTKAMVVGNAYPIWVKN